MKASETLETAASLVSDDRAKQHGDMFHSHDLIAKLWSVYFSGVGSHRLLILPRHKP